MAENDLLDETVVSRAKPLTPEDAIGNPESEDFPIMTCRQWHRWIALGDPLLKGIERLMQAEFSGCFGHAFTDMYGDFEGTLTFSLWNLTTTTGSDLCCDAAMQ